MGGGIKGAAGCDQDISGTYAARSGRIMKEDDPTRAQLLKELESRAAGVEDDVPDLTLRIRARQSRSPPSKTAVASGDGSSGGMLSFVAGARAQSDMDSARIEEMIASTMDTAVRAQEAERQAGEQHHRLIAEFGQAAVDAWKTEFDGAVEELIAGRDATLRPTEISATAVPPTRPVASLPQPVAQPQPEPTRAQRMARMHATGFDLSASATERFATDAAPSRPTVFLPQPVAQPQPEPTRAQRMARMRATGFDLSFDGEGY